MKMWHIPELRAQEISADKMASTDIVDQGTPLSHFSHRQPPVARQSMVSANAISLRVLLSHVSDPRQRRKPRRVGRKDFKQNVSGQAKNYDTTRIIARQISVLGLVA